MSNYISVGNQRKDGKFSCVVVFPFSGKQFKKIFTREKILEMGANDYEIRGLPAS